MKIAIVGSGVSGLGCAWYLRDQNFDITVFERGDYLGGHAHTLYVPYSKNGITHQVPVNTAYDLFSKQFYPLYVSLLNDLGLEVEEAEFSYNFRSGAVGDGAAPWEIMMPTLLNFRNAKQLFRSSYRRFAREVLRLGTKIQKFDGAARPDLTFGEFLKEAQVSQLLAEQFLLVVFARPWGITPTDVAQMPAEILVGWLATHKTLTPFPVKWFTNKNGAKAYMDCLVERLKSRGVRFQTNCPVHQVRRCENMAFVTAGTELEAGFDHVILATNAEQALAVIADPTVQERQCLGEFHYQTNQILVHSDTQFLPADPRRWSYFNVYFDTKTNDSYNSIWFGQKFGVPVFATNYRRLSLTPDESKVYARYSYQQPILTPATLRVRRELARIQGLNRTWFAGVHLFGSGHHEHGLQSAKVVAEMLTKSCPKSAEVACVA